MDSHSQDCNGPAAQGQHVESAVCDGKENREEGKIKWKETMVEGLENAPPAFIGLFNGKNFEKMLVKLGTA